MQMIENFAAAFLKTLTRKRTSQHHDHLRPVFPASVDAAPQAAAPKQDKAAEFAEAVEKANNGDSPSALQVMEYLGVSKATLKRRMKECGYHVDCGGLVVPLDE